MSIVSKRMVLRQQSLTFGSTRWIICDNVSTSCCQWGYIIILICDVAGQLCVKNGQLQSNRYSWELVLQSLSERKRKGTRRTWE